MKVVQESDFSAAGGVSYYVPKAGCGMPLAVRAIWSLSNGIHSLGSWLGVAMGAFERRRITAIPLGDFGGAQLVDRRGPAPGQK